MPLVFKFDGARDVHVFKDFDKPSHLLFDLAAPHSREIWEVRAPGDAPYGYFASWEEAALFEIIGSGLERYDMTISEMQDAITFITGWTPTEVFTLNSRES